MLNRIIAAVAMLAFLLPAGHALVHAVDAPIHATAGIGNCTVPQGELNATSCGASGSARSTIGSISAGSNRLMLAVALDFVNGEGIAISHAGLPNTAAAPTGFTAALPDWPGARSPLPYNSTGAGHQYLVKPINNNSGNNIYELTGVSGQGITGGSEPAWFSGCAAANSTCTDNGIAWTQHTINYTTVYTYKLAGLDTNFGISAATSGFTCTGPSSLSELSPCVVKWTAGANEIGVLIYRNNSLIAAVPAADGVFNDVGYPAGGAGTYWPDFPSSPPLSALPGRLITSVSSGGGTQTLTIANAATSAIASQAVNHDDTAALQAWLNTLFAVNGSQGYCPQGTYHTTSTVNIITSDSGVGIHVVGSDARNEGPAGCDIVYNGDPNKAILYTNGLHNSHLEHLTLNANAQAIYGLQMDNSDGNHSSSGVIWSVLQVANASPSVNAAGIEFGHPGMGPWQVSEITLEKSVISYYWRPNISNVGIRTEQANGDLKNFWFLDDEVKGFAHAYDLGGVGVTTIADGDIAQGTNWNIYDRGSDTVKISGQEIEGDAITGDRFYFGAGGAGSLPSILESNSWESGTWTDDVVVNTSGAILTANSFHNGRTSTSVARVIASNVDDATPGTLYNETLVSMYNYYENVPPPYLPPIYDGSYQHVVDLINAYPFPDTGQAIPIISLGDKTFTPSNGDPVNLLPVNAIGGDQVITRLFAAGKAGVPIIDSNGGSPILKNTQVQLNSTAFNSLMLSTNGASAFCSDCKNSVDDAATVGAACAAGGHGAVAIRINSANRCY